MEIFFTSRKNGKTIKSIEISAETQKHIVCCNINECLRIQKIANELNLKIPCPITFDEFLNKQYYGQGIKGFIIDNADMLLQRLSNIPIEFITMTWEG